MVRGRHRRCTMWKNLRIVGLLAIFALVASDAWFDQRRAHAWRQTLHVGLFPLAADDSPLTREYVANLERSEFVSVESFFARQARDHGLSLYDPVRVELYPPIAAVPPAPPAAGGPLSTLWWSLQMRYFAARFGRAPNGPSPLIRVFVLYHDPARMSVVPHSAGLDKGLIGLVHVFAIPRMRGSNNVVLAHEILHTVGATDKYDPTTNAPLFPAGFGDPDQQPRYPQQFAEIMAGRRALSAATQEMPESLDECVVGAVTAAEIRWTGR
jgi:hypothetical protein